MKNVLSVGDECNVDCYELSEELQVLSSVIPSHISDIRDMFKFIVQRKMSEVYPNIFVLLRIITTVPVTIASAERSFSRLKLIKICLRTTMAQERLAGLAILSTENNVASALDYSEILG
jgi:hypothetical protein